MVVLLVLVACGMACSCLGRISLESYLERLDDIRSASDQAFTQMKNSMESNSSGGSATQDLYRSMDEAEAVLTECEKRIEDLKPPPAASRLHELVTKLFSESRDFFAEVKAMLKYSAEREAVVSKVQSASRDLDAGMAAGGSGPGTYQALSTAAARVAAARAELETLEPPEVLQGVQDALLGMLNEYATSLKELSSAVQSADANAINAAQAKVRAALSSNLDEETGKSIDTFNAGIDLIERLRREVNAEETRITGGR